MSHIMAIFQITLCRLHQLMHEVNNELENDIEGRWKFNLSSTA